MTLSNCVQRLAKPSGERSKAKDKSSMACGKLLKKGRDLLINPAGKVIRFGFAQQVKFTPG